MGVKKNKKKKINEERDLENDGFADVDGEDAEGYASVTPNWKERELTSKYMSRRVKGPGFDIPFLVITLVILAFGLIMLFSASYARQSYLSEDPMWMFSRQLFFAVTGLGIMFATASIRVSAISRFSMILLLAAFALLVLVLIIGIRLNGATRWIAIGGEDGFTVQPSEIAKLALVLAFAQMICRYGRKRMATFRYGVFPFALVTGTMIILLYLQPHLSASIIIAVISLIMMFAGGTRLRWFLFAGMLLTAGIILMMMTSARTVVVDAEHGDVQHSTIVEWDFSRFGYAGRRINAWMDPESDPLEGGFQIRQSLNAVGSGGLLGQGLGQSRQKHFHLPEEHNDFIFAVVGEELGFIGSMLILLLFALLIVRGYWLALNAKDRFSSLITIGIMSLLAIQVFLNVAVVTNLLPATGISLPFFSYGGTALWVQMLQMGIVLSVSREIPTTADYEQRNKPDKPGEDEVLVN